MNHAQAEFMASVTRQLRSPVNTMLGVLQTLAADPDTRARHGTSLSALLARGQEILAMVADLQDLAKLERGELVPFLESVDPIPALEEAVAAARPFLGGRSLRLEVSLAALPRAFVTDALFLRRIVFNLLGTAISRTPEGTLTLGGEAAGAGLSIWVGGPATDLGELEENSGSALQIAAARGLTERLGGTLEVTGGEANGSLRLSLPPGRF
jgi:signal transduction histidine kinase